MAAMSVEAQIGEVKGQLGELRGQVDGLSNRMDDMHHRMDDMHRLLVMLIGVAGGGLLTAVVGLILQLLKT